MPRKVKRGCTGSPRRSRRGHGRKSLEVKARKRVYGCSGSRKRRQSKKPMRGGFNEQALQEVLDAALSSTSGGALSGARLNGGQGGGSRRRSRRARRARRVRRSMRGGSEGAEGNSAQSTGLGQGLAASVSAGLTEDQKEQAKIDSGTQARIEAADLRRKAQTTNSSSNNGGYDFGGFTFGE